MRQGQVKITMNKEHSEYKSQYGRYVNGANILKSSSKNNLAGSGYASPMMRKNQLVTGYISGSPGQTLKEPGPQLIACSRERRMTSKQSKQNIKQHDIDEPIKVAKQKRLKEKQQNKSPTIKNILQSLQKVQRIKVKNSLKSINKNCQQKIKTKTRAVSSKKDQPSSIKQHKSRKVQQKICIKQKSTSPQKIKKQNKKIVMIRSETSSGEEKIKKKTKKNKNKSKSNKDSKKIKNKKTLKQVKSVDHITLTLQNNPVKKRPSSAMKRL